MSVPSDVIPKKYLKRPVTPIKSPKMRIKYNQAMKDELRKCKVDPLYFLEHYFYIQHPLRGRLIFKAYPYQAEMINNFLNYRNNIAMLGRQMGKCCKNTTLIKIRNKNTGEVKEITISDFFKINKCGKEDD